MLSLRAVQKQVNNGATRIIRMREHDVFANLNVLQHPRFVVLLKLREDRRASAPGGELKDRAVQKPFQPLDVFRSC